MADTDLPRDAAKVLQQLSDASRNSGKSVELTADKIRLLARAFNQMQESAAAAGKDITDVAKNIQAAFDDASGTLVRFTKTGLTEGYQLQSMFAAIASMILDEPVKKLNEELIKENKILDDLSKNQNKLLEDAVKEKKTSEDAIKGLKDKIAQEEKYCKKRTLCDDSAIASLKDQLKNEENVLKKKDDAVSKAKETIEIEGDGVKQQKDKIKALQDQAAKLESIKKLAKEMLEIFTDAFDRFVELDREAEVFRNNTRLMRDQMVEIEKAALNINQELISQGVTIEKAYKSAEALFISFSNSYAVTQEQIRAVSQLNANLGVTESNAAGFLQKMESVGGLTSKQAIGMAGLAAGAAKAAGVPLDKVMHDVANASDTTLTMMKGNVRQMTLAAIQAQRLGVNLEKSAAAARGLLNFQDSVDAEMEASVLLGRSLNLNYARQLSFAGDIAGSQKEILNQVRSMGDFTKMNVFQQEALAKATGYSVADLTSMLKNEEKLSKLKPKQKKAYEEATKALKEQNEETGEQLLQQAQMQSAMNQLSNTFKSFKQILADILTPVVNVAVKLLIPALKLGLVIFNAMLIPVKILAKALDALWEPIEPVVQKISDALDGTNVYIEKIVQGTIDLGVALIKVSFPIKVIIDGFSFISRTIRIIGVSIRSLGQSISNIGSIFRPIGSIISYIGRQINVIGKTGDILKPIFNTVIRLFSMVNNIATGLLTRITGFTSLFGSATGMVGRFASGFGSIGRIFGILNTAKTFFGPIGWILTALQGIWGMFTRLKSGMGFFEAFGETLYDVFVGPFEMIITLLGKIPIIGVLFQQISKIFPVIKTGITSVFNFLQSGWNLIKNIFTGKDVINSIMSIGKMIFTSMFFIPVTILTAIVKIFPKAWSAIKEFFSGVVDKIKGLFSGGGGIGEFIINAVKNVFSVVTMVPMLMIQGFIWYIKTVPMMIWDAVTGIFSKIKEWLSTFDVFGGIFKGLSSIGGGLVSGVTDKISSIGNVVGSVFSETEKETPNTTVTKTETSSDVIAAIQETNRKMDALITLMSNGGISVYLDGRKVSEQLAYASS
jgi:hypothetical protein